MPASSSSWLFGRRERLGAVFFSIIFLTRRLSVSSDMPLPSGPFTDSLKKERNSRTPCEVCAYLLATARLTVEGCTPISSRPPDHHGLQRVGTVIEKFTWRAIMDWQTRQNGVFALLDVFSSTGWRR